MKKFISILIVSSLLMVTCVWAEESIVISRTDIGRVKDTYKVDYEGLQITKKIVAKRYTWDCIYYSLMFGGAYLNTFLMSRDNIYLRPVFSAGSIASLYLGINTGKPDIYFIIDKDEHSKLNNNLIYRGLRLEKRTIKQESPWGHLATALLSTYAFGSTSGGGMDGTVIMSFLDIAFLFTAIREYQSTIKCAFSPDSPQVRYFVPEVEQHKLTQYIKPNYFIRNVKYEGNTAIANWKLKTFSPIKAKRKYSEGLMKYRINILKEWYSNKGYPHADIEYDVEFDTATLSADLIIKINEGNKNE